MNHIGRAFLLLCCLGLSVSYTQAMINDETQNVIDLVKAAYNGEIENVKQLLEKKASPNEFVKSNLSHVVLKRPHNPNASLNALSAAVYGKQKEVVQLLLSQNDINPSPNLTSPTQLYPALWLAIYDGKYDIAKLLLESNANPNQQNKVYDKEKKETVNDNTPLHIAAQQDNIPLIKLLLEHNADKDLTNAAGQTPLQVAEFYKHTEIIKLLKGETSEISEEEIIEEPIEKIEEIISEEEKETEAEKKEKTPEKPSKEITLPTETDLLDSLGKLHQSLLSLTKKL